jgi:hypothetical protein
LCFGEPKLLASSNYKVRAEHSALDRTLEHVLPIKFAELVEREVFLGNVSRIKKLYHKNVIPRLHFRVAGSFLVAAERAFRLRDLFDHSVCNRRFGLAA